MEEVKGNIQRLNAENIELKRRVDKLEDSDMRHEEDIRQLYAHQEGTKVYVTQILNKIENLETKLFNALTQQSRTSLEERKDWKELIKYVIGATIGALIIYLFTNGGV